MKAYLTSHRAVAAAGGILIALSLSALEASAAEVSRRAFSKFGSANCPLSGACGVDFGTVPAKHRYEIRSVSCYLSIENVNGRVLYWYLHGRRSNNDPLGRIHLRPNFLGTTSTSVTYNATEQGLVVVAAGGGVSVAMTRDSSTAGGIPGIDCTISGDDVTLQ